MTCFITVSTYRYHDKTFRVHHIRLTYKYDVVVAGGSISGLLCAREISSQGYSVLVLEKSHEIGTPQHCGGLVSRAALDYLGVIPSSQIAGNHIKTAKIVSPNGHSIQVGAGDGILEVDRRMLDKYVAEQAQNNGAHIWSGVSFKGTSDGTVKSSSGDIPCSIVIDARGAHTLSGPNLLASAQYEICADWIRQGEVTVILDNLKYPGFFAWVIPTRSGIGKVGVGGYRIDVTATMQSLLDDMGNYSIFRRIIAPIWVGGPLPDVVRDNTILVGDAAGQTKPTTGGGIYSSGAGGMLAGRAVVKYLETDDRNHLNYSHIWKKRFGGEFEAQHTVRKILARLDNVAIDSLLHNVQPHTLKQITDDGDFDFHVGAILALLGVRGVAHIAKDITANEMRRASAYIQRAIRR
ncbi:MAG: NAD(P)/FAD-dependent oxidoreductase [Cenarchaeum sp. SB0663_bin_5]|nr:NAD(P)/FAD-dependent oxidoreductase [Cenarchaeum sp. SB0663_bin_5]MYH04038.1 NAD(P)/FAD-dependent oxidoreductase [Cenarchaeum sp. SB0675_bin_21]MYL10958.1 NAD(P)/FAD-dependent oxidoreductase [Cenarchaeum sp. SB0669_bin_11]